MYTATLLRVSTDFWRQVYYYRYTAVYEATIICGHDWIAVRVGEGKEFDSGRLVHILIFKLTFLVGFNLCNYWAHSAIP